MIQTLRRRVNVKILILDIKAIKVKLINVYIKRKEKRNPQNFSMYFIDSQPSIRQTILGTSRKWLFLTGGCLIQ